MKGGLLLDVVIREGPPVLELLSSEDQPLLIRRDALFVLKEKWVLINLRNIDLNGIPGSWL